ncbi:MAG: hypothetical protein ACI841_001800 [Planctomycetota bacterium]|jgi:hypothetical protein
MGKIDNQSTPLQPKARSQGLPWSASPILALLLSACATPTKNRPIAESRASIVAPLAVAEEVLIEAIANRVPAWERASSTFHWSATEFIERRQARNKRVKSALTHSNGGVNGAADLVAHTLMNCARALVH